jgi:hypothetical protein
MKKPPECQVDLLDLWKQGHFRPEVAERDDTEASRCPFGFWVSTAHILTEIFRGVPEYLKANAEISTTLKPPLFPSKS